MTIASQTSRITYTGDGATTAFAVPFYFAANADLVVILQDTVGNQYTQILGTNYSLSGATLSAGGTCTFTSAPTTGYLVVIYRDPPVTQTTSYNNNDPFPAKSHELALDKLTTIQQRFKSQLGRAISLPETSSVTNPHTTAPVASEWLRWNAAANGIESSAIVTSSGSYAVATQSDAIAGALNNELMTPLRAAQAAAVQVYPTRADVAAAIIPVGLLALRTTGYAAAGDGGGALYNRVVSQPSHAGKIQSLDGAWWVLAANPVRAEMLGGKLDGVTFEEGILQSGIAVAAALKTEFHLPAGTLLVRTTLTKSPLSTLRYYAADLVSNTRIRGVRGQTTIKIADSQSILASIKDVNIFVVDGALTNISFDGIIFDCNGQNNAINNGSQCNGAINITGNSASVDKMFIRRCGFINCAGTNNIVLGQNTNGVAGSVSSNVRILDCYFDTNGFDTADYTTIYGWCNQLWIQRCRFSQPAGQSKTGRNWVAVELHGANNWFTDCVVLNYFRACWCASNFTNDSVGQYVLNNTFDVFGAGPSMFREISTLTGLRYVYIENNVITMRSGATSPVVEIYGIQCATLYSINDIYIRKNLIIDASTGYTTYGLLLGSLTSGQTNSFIFFEDNVVKFATKGFYAAISNAGQLIELYERNNTYYQLGVSNGTPSSSGSTFSQAGTSTFGRFTSRGNYHLGDGTNYDNGITTVGTLGVGIIENNYFTGVTVQLNYTGTITTSFGLQGIRISGTTAQRPAYLAPKDEGFTYYDSTLSKVIMWSGSAWLV